MEKRKRNRKQTDHEVVTQETVPTLVPTEPVVIPLIHENLQVEKQWVEAGEVVIRKRVEARTETVPVELGFEEVQVERVPVNRVLADGETLAPRQEGDTLVIPVVEEELVVLKRRVLREEVRVSKQRMMRQEQVSDVVRSEQIDVETTGRLQTQPETPSLPT